MRPPTGMGPRGPQSVNSEIHLNYIFDLKEKKWKMKRKEAAWRLTRSKNSSPRLARRLWISEKG